MHFYCEKNYTCGQQLGPSEINRPDTEDVKCMGVENLAGGGVNPHTANCVCCKCQNILNLSKY